MEFGEPLETAAIRETREETGIDIAIDNRIDMAEIFWRNGTDIIEFHAVLIVFSGRYAGGELTAGDDAAEARWVTRDGLAGLDLTGDTRRVIETHGFRP